MKDLMETARSLPSSPSNTWKEGNCRSVIDERFYWRVFKTMVTPEQTQSSWEWNCKKQQRLQKISPLKCRFWVHWILALDVWRGKKISLLVAMCSDIFKWEKKAQSYLLLVWQTLRRLHNNWTSEPRATMPLKEGLFKRLLAFKLCITWVSFTVAAALFNQFQTWRLL